MPRYRIELRRETIEHGIASIEAANRDEAANAALDPGSLDIEWETVDRTTKRVSVDMDPEEDEL